VFYFFTTNFVIIGLIVAVDDLQEFHTENIKQNKTHYQYTARIFKARFISFFSKYGARIHINTFKLDNDKTMQYGIIKMQDLVQDLKLWETLYCSSFLMRPYQKLQECSEIESAQQNNLISATALAGILTKNGESETEFYKNIVSIPHYKTYSSIFQLVDNEDPDLLVKDKLEGFRDIYDPILKSAFKDEMSIENGLFKKDESDSVTKYLLSNLNDNVYQNMYTVMSPLKYDPEKKFHKKVLDEKSYDLIDSKTSLMSEDNLAKKCNRSIDKILLAHRNSKILLILISGPFLFALYVVKYSIKILILYILYKRNKKVADSDKKDDSKDVISEEIIA
jgi:hypothetical protein